MELGERLGAENFVGYFKQFGLLSKTNIDLPGEAGTIMHKTENIGPVELATISFGQSFQITPIQLVTTVSSIINGGTRVTPHFGVSVQDADGNTVKTFSYETHENICTAETSETMRYLLEKVVSEGTGKMPKLRAFPSAERQQPHRHFQEATINTFHRFSDLRPLTIRRCLCLLLLTIRRGFITAERSLLLWRRKYSKTFCLTLINEMK